jgi:hypothetical protein
MVCSVDAPSGSRTVRAQALRSRLIAGLRALLPVIAVALAARILPLPLAVRLLPTAMQGGFAADGMHYYQPLMRGLVERGEFALEPGRPTSRHVPLYPLWLAALEKVGASTDAAHAAAQSLLGALALVLLFFWVRDLAGQRPAWIALGLGCIVPDFATYAYLPMSETLAAVFVLAALLRFERARRSAGLCGFLAAGACLGLAALTREFSLTLAVPMIASLLWYGRARAARAGALLCLAALATVLPWSLRNYRTFGEFLLLSEKGGWVAYIGTLAGPHPAGSALWSWSDPMRRARHEDLLRELARETSPRRRGRLCWRAAWENFSENPGAQIRHLLTKSWFFWMPNVGSRHSTRLGLLPWLLLSEIVYGLCLAAAAGAAFTRQGRAVPCAILWLLIGWIAAFHISFGSAEPRYHFLLLPAVFALAGVSLESVRGIHRRPQPATA